jgi:hypothetical protein
MTMKRRLEHRGTYYVSMYPRGEERHEATPERTVVCETASQAKEVVVGEMRRSSNRQNGALISLRNVDDPWDPKNTTWAFLDGLWGREE